MTTRTFGEIRADEAGWPSSPPDAGGAAAAARALYSNTTPVLSTATTSEEDLMSYTLPGGSLAAAGDRLNALAWGAFSSAARTKTIRVRFGGTVLFTTGSLLFGLSDWAVEIKIIRTGASAQVSIAVFSGDVTINPATAARGSASITLSSDAILKVTSEVGAGASAGDTRQSGMIVDLVKAP